jgi:hypothetical protein
MKLEELVPNIKLCKLIPDGAFADSAFYWFQELQYINEKQPHDYRYFVSFADFHGYGWGGGRCCPAPTLQEILAELTEFEVWKNNIADEFNINSEFLQYTDENPATAALKVWLELEGENK